MRLKKIGRNEPCPCGSGKKYKTCCHQQTVPVELRVKELFALALQYHQAGELVQAENFYRQILVIHPTHSDTLHYLAIVLHQTGKNDDAIALINKAISINPDFAMYNNLANILRGQQKLVEAIYYYQQALALKPDYAEAYNNLGVAFKEQHNLAAAIVNYQQAIALKPDYAAAYINLAIVLNEQHHLDAAVVNYQKAITLKPM